MSIRHEYLVAFTILHWLFVRVFLSPCSFEGLIDLLKVFASLKYLGVHMVGLSTNTWTEHEENRERWPTVLGVLVVFMFHLTCLDLSDRL